MKNSYETQRRVAVKRLILGAFSPGVSLLLSENANAADKVVIQYDWLLSNGQIGDLVAAQKGYFKDAGLEVELNPGGPNAVTIPPVVSGRATLGQLSETPQLFSARSNGIPVKMIAAGYRTGPYALTSLPAKPLRTVADLKGLRIGIQPTARFVIEAIAKKNGIDMKDLQLVNVGFDKAPLLRGDVDVLGGWITNTQSLSVLGENRIDLLVSDLGLASYANVYLASDEAIESRSDVLAKFVGAVSKGWAWSYENPQDAVRLAVQMRPELNLESELKTIPLILRLSFDVDTKRDGWGVFDPKSLDKQLELYDRIGQYPKGRPKTTDVYSLEILKKTQLIRPKLG